MNRREAVQHIALLLGGTIVGANAFLAGCKTKTGVDLDWTPDEIVYLDEIADTILPTTSTPGAKAAQVGRFMTVMVNDCYEEKDQKAFVEGMDTLNDEANKQFKNKFMQLNPQQRHDLLVRLDKEQQEYSRNKKPDDPVHYFRMMKELTMLGYFTSKIGMTVARRYVAVPGRYEGCVPYTKGEKAWA